MLRGLEVKELEQGLHPSQNEEGEAITTNVSEPIQERRTTRGKDISSAWSSLMPKTRDGRLNSESGLTTEEQSKNIDPTSVPLLYRGFY